MTDHHRHLVWLSRSGHGLVRHLVPGFTPDGYSIKFPARIVREVVWPIHRRPLHPVVVQLWELADARHPWHFTDDPIHFRDRLRRYTHLGGPA